MHENSAATRIQAELVAAGKHTWEEARALVHGNSAATRVQAELVAVGKHTWEHARALVHGNGASTRAHVELVAGGYSWAKARALVLLYGKMPKNARVEAKALALGKTLTEKGTTSKLRNEALMLVVTVALGKY